MAIRTVTNTTMATATATVPTKPNENVKEVCGRLLKSYLRSPNDLSKRKALLNLGLVALCYLRKLLF
jgi:hypothetical protein